VSATRAVAIVAVGSPNTLSGEIVVSEGEKASNGVTQENNRDEHRLMTPRHTTARAVRGAANFVGGRKLFRESFRDFHQIRPRGEDSLRAPVTDPQL